MRWFKVADGDYVNLDAVTDMQFRQEPAEELDGEPVLVGRLYFAGCLPGGQEYEDGIIVLHRAIRGEKAIALRDYVEELCAP